VFAGNGKILVNLLLRPFAEVDPWFDSDEDFAGTAFSIPEEVKAAHSIRRLDPISCGLDPAGLISTPRGE
jgi:hypothetical protein